MFVESNYTGLVGKCNVEPRSNEPKFHIWLENSHWNIKIKIIIISWGNPPVDALIRLRDPSPTSEMGTRMKGLIKGLRYISQIFDDDSSEEEEMQIGNPTDVKHVAHIGWDGPSVVHNAPSWMEEFSKSPAPLPDPTPRDNPEIQKISEVPKQSKKSRRHNSAAVSMTSPTRDIVEGVKPSRRNKNLSDGAVQNSSPARESVVIPKQSKKKKSKDTSVGGSTRGRRKECSPLKCTFSSDDPGSGGP